MPVASGRAKPKARRRWRSDHPVRILAAAFGLIAVFGSGLLLSGYVPFSLNSRSTMEAEHGSADEFGRTRVGEVLFATGAGNACRKNQFYNDTGLFGPDTKVRCDTGLPEGDTAGARRSINGGRLMSLRDAFLNR